MFSNKTFGFLKELSENNDKAWFEANKDRYEREVREPALAYIEAMAMPLGRISGHFLAAPKKVGGSLMRVYRDVRFSKDKTPYKTNIGIQFRHARGRDVHAPGYYLHLDCEQVFVGVGIWHPEGAMLNQVRLLIDDEPKIWLKAKASVDGKKGFELVGDSLKRPPKGYPADHPRLEDLKRKDYLAMSKLTRGVVTGKNCVKDTAALFRQANPFMRFLCEAADLEF